MRGKLPGSPFATRFSGPARETEARLRSLFRFKRKPPAALVALTLAAALFCGGLVSCQEVEAEKGPTPPGASLAPADPNKLPPPDLALAPVDWDNLPEPDPVYTPKLDGSVVIQNLRDAHAEWNRRSTGNFLYFAGDPAFCCPGLAGRTAEGSAQWQEEEGSAVVVDLAVNDDRLEDGTVGGYSLHFAADWYKETVLESSFTSDVGDGTLELSQEEILYAGEVLARLMLEAEGRAAAVSDLDLAALLMQEHENYRYSAGSMSSRLLLSREGEGCVLGLALVNGGQHPAGSGNLMLGLWDPEERTWRGPVYTVGGDDGLFSSWTAADGSLHILCANTVTWTGYETFSAAAHFRFDGKALEEVKRWENLYPEEDVKLIPAEGGFEVSVRNPQYLLQYQNPEFSGVPLPAPWVYDRFEPAEN